MKVYIVSDDRHGDGSEIHGVYDSLNKAMNDNCFGNRESYGNWIAQDPSTGVLCIAIHKQFSSARLAIFEWDVE
jgi:hypothetical protein